MTHQATDLYGPVDAAAVDDEPWLAAPSRRSRLRVLLVVLLLALVVFVAGAQVQKRFGDDSSTSAGSLPTNPISEGQGLQGAPGGSLPDSLGSATSPSGSSSDASGGTGESSGSSTPVLIGTVTAIRARTWTVKDLGGETHTVRLTPKTTITRPADQTADPVRVGVQVSVEGSKHGSSVTATALTIR